jgi:hypothetical protein
MLKEKCHALEWPLTSYTSKVRFSDEYYEELPDGHENVLKDYLSFLLVNSGDSVTRHGPLLDSRTSPDHASSHSLQAPGRNENDVLDKTPPQIGEPPSKKIKETLPKGSDRSAPLKRASKV